MAGKGSLIKLNSAKEKKGISKKGTARKANGADLKPRSSTKTLTCDRCSYVAKAPSQLMQHIRKHTNEKPYKCTVCDFSTGHPGAMHKHERHHTGDKPYKCKQCSFAASYASLLRYHMRTHTGEKPFECALCDFTSAHLGSLHSHLKVHEGVRPYSCDKCNFTAAYRCQLKKHSEKCSGISHAPLAKRKRSKESLVRSQLHDTTVEPSCEVSSSQKLPQKSMRAKMIKSEPSCLPDPGDYDMLNSSDRGDMDLNLNMDTNLLSKTIEDSSKTSTTAESTQSDIMFNVDSFDFRSAELEPRIFVCSKCNYITLEYPDLIKHKACHN